MKYISTRGKSPELNFCDVLLGGLAPDGGLYLPKMYPKFTKNDFINLNITKTLIPRSLHKKQLLKTSNSQTTMMRTSISPMWNKIKRQCTYFEFNVR